MVLGGRVEVYCIYHKGKGEECLKGVYCLMGKGMICLFTPKS